MPPERLLIRQPGPLARELQEQREPGPMVWPESERVEPGERPKQAQAEVPAVPEQEEQCPPELFLLKAWAG